MNRVPDLLVEQAREPLRLIDSGEVLGASRQLVLLGDCLTALVRSGADEPTLATAVQALVDYVAVSRGESSQAVINGLRLMAAPALTSPAPGRALADDIETAVAAFRASLQAWMTSVRSHATQRLSTGATFLAYDYSSTVSQVLAELRRGGGAVTVFLPEARSLDGGVKYLADWQDLGITAHLIPDSALGWALNQCDAALAGAETLSAEGGCYNTIGTALAAHEAHRLGIPFYILSVLLKTDPRTAAGQRRVPTLDFTSRRYSAVRLRSGSVEILGDFPDLDYTPPTVITGLITERGILEPAHIAEAASSLLVEGVTAHG